MLISPGIPKKFTVFLLHPGMHAHIRQLDDVQLETAYMCFSKSSVIIKCCLAY